MHLSKSLRTRRNNRSVGGLRSVAAAIPFGGADGAAPSETEPRGIFRRPLFLSALFSAALAVSASAATPSVEHPPTGASYSLKWGPAAQIADVTFSLRVNGDWIYGDAFPRRVWSAENGRQVLRCSGLPPLEEFVLAIETAPNRPYAVVSATLKASAEFKLGGVRVLTTKDSAANLAVAKPLQGWTVFVECLPAPHHGRIYSLEQLAQLKPARRDDPRDAFWVSTLQNDARNHTYAFAALKGELWPTAFEWRQGQDGALQLSVRSGSPSGVEQILVRPGRVVEVDPVLIGYFRQGHQCLRQHRNILRRRQPPFHPRTRPPVASRGRHAILTLLCYVLSHPP